MDLIFNLNQKDGVWIDGSHRVFEKSEFDGLGFRIKIKSLTRTELRKIRKEAETAKGFNQDLAFPKIFFNQVQDWELKGAEGQPIPFSEENKKILIEQFPGFTNLVAAACLDAQISTASEDEIKKLVDFWYWRIKNDGENPKYCAGCRKKFEDEGNDPPCEDCPREHEPLLLPENFECFDVHRLCWSCREGMNGNLDYHFVGILLDKFGFDENEWIAMLQKIQIIEGKLRELRDREIKK